MRMIISNTAQ